MNDFSNNWKDRPELTGIPKEKLELLQKLAETGNQKTPTELLTFLMQTANNPANSMHFSTSEISNIINVLKTGKTKEEISRIDRMISLLNMIHK